MSALTKKPIQIYLRAEQLEALRALARRRQVAVSELVREGVDEVLAAMSVDEEPLSDIVGMFDSGRGDLADRHDDYLVQHDDQGSTDA